MRRVELCGVRKRYGRRAPWVLAGVDAALEHGTVTEITGVNGSGKSTLLRLLAGCTEPTRGTRRAPSTGSVGYSPDAILPHAIRGSAYLRHHARIRGADAIDVARVSGRLGCGALLDQPMAHLSAGSLHKLVLVQAFVSRPDLVVLDEPFARLDGQARAALCSLIAESASRGAAVVFSEHSAGSPRPPANATLVVAGGRLLERAHI